MYEEVWSMQNVPPSSPRSACKSSPNTSNDRQVANASEVYMTPPMTRNRSGAPIFETTADAYRDREVSGLSRITCVSQRESNVRGAPETDKTAFDVLADLASQQAPVAGSAPPGAAGSSGDSIINESSACSCEACDGIGCCDFMVCSSSSCSEQGCTGFSPPAHCCPHHLVQSTSGRCADDNFLCCQEDHLFSDPDETEVDPANYQSDAEEMEPDDEEAEVIAAALRLSALRGSIDYQLPPVYRSTRTTARVQQPPNYRETLSTKAQESLAMVERTLASDLGHRWAPPTNCKRPRSKPKRFQE